MTGGRAVKAQMAASGLRISMLGHQDEGAALKKYREKQNRLIKMLRASGKWRESEQILVWPLLG